MATSVQIFTKHSKLNHENYKEIFINHKNYRLTQHAPRYGRDVFFKINVYTMKCIT